MEDFYKPIPTPEPVEWLVSKIFGDAKYQKQWANEIAVAKDMERLQVMKFLESIEKQKIKNNG
jgi:hypothetical protein